MVIGHGMLAKLFFGFNNQEDVLIFASGVSNSKEIRNSEFDREFNLLRDCIRANSQKTIVYFATSSMYDPLFKNSPYVKHKLAMEEFIEKNVNKYHIFRISQIIGRAQNQTLINFLIDHILQEKEFDVWSNATRNLIAVNDAFSITDYIIKNKLYVNQVINIANSTNISMPELVKILEKILNKNAKANMLEQGFPFEQIDISKIEPICVELGINFNDQNYSLNAINAIIKNENYGV